MSMWNMHDCGCMRACVCVCVWGGGTGKLAGVYCPKNNSSCQSTQNGGGVSVHKERFIQVQYKKKQIFIQLKDHDKSFICASQNSSARNLNTYEVRL